MNLILPPPLLLPLSTAWLWQCSAILIKWKAPTAFGTQFRAFPPFPFTEKVPFHFWIAYRNIIIEYVMMDLWIYFRRWWEHTLLQYPVIKIKDGYLRSGRSIFGCHALISRVSYFIYLQVGLLNIRYTLMDHYSFVNMPFLTTNSLLLASPRSKKWRI